jgi:hypothetical protein
MTAYPPYGVGAPVGPVFASTFERLEEELVETQLVTMVLDDSELLIGYDTREKVEDTTDHEQYGQHDEEQRDAHGE